MPSHVAFLRAVNVAPRWLKMDTARAALVADGFEDVESHIQSGNLRVRSRMRSADRVAERISRVLSAEAGFEVPTVVRSAARLRQIARMVDEVAPMLPGEPRRYLAFASAEIGADAARALADWDRPGERAVVVGGDHVVIDLTVPAHAARLSNAKAETLTDTVMTMRDIKVVRTLGEKWGEG